jgi:transposase
MFIRRKRKQNPGSSKTYLYHQLVEAVRTAEGPRQHLLLDLKDLGLPREKWPLLARGIEARVRGQTQLLCLDEEVVRAVERYAGEVEREWGQGCRGEEEEAEGYEQVEVGSMRQTHPRSVGGEYVGVEEFRRLKLEECLKKAGLSRRQIELAYVLVIGRMVSPGSERHTHEWVRRASGLGEVLGVDLEHVSLNSLYEVTDMVEERREEIEVHLREVERSLFGLDEAIILYDLTNTYFEGGCEKNGKGKYGRSKEKRNDCRLVTLGLVVDGAGFVKRSKVFGGNVNEGKTLEEMIESLREGDGAGSEPVTVVMDAGIAREENLEKLRGKYHYICVARNRPKEEQGEGVVRIRGQGGTEIEAEIVKRGGEVYVRCRSEGRKAKEGGMRRRQQERFEERLREIASGVEKKGGTKKYEKVWERIGRAKEKYARIAQYYEIGVEAEGGVATRVWWRLREEAAAEGFSGKYYLRTDREDLREEEIWKIYMMLQEVEDAFRTMKTDLGLRPNHHKKEGRSDGHIFITVLAYHLVHGIRTRLKDAGINCRWKTIAERLERHGRVTCGMNRKGKKRVYVRQCTEPEEEARKIYEALGLGGVPCERRMFTI